MYQGYRPAAGHHHIEENNVEFPFLQGLSRINSATYAHDIMPQKREA